MPKQVAKSGLSAKLGTSLKKAVDAHKNDETNYGGGGDLPAGIENGVAQLVDCKFDVYKDGDMKGEYYFYAAGVVKRPHAADGVVVEGLRTSIMEPVCGTPTRTRKSVEEHVDWVLNEFRKLGVDTSGFDEGSLEAAAAALKEAKPHFRFRTWKGAKQTEGPYKDREPRVQHQWKGICDFSEDGEDAVDDQTVGEPTEAPDNGATEAVESELRQLADAADGGDEDAAAKIAEAAAAVGVDPEELESWAAVVEAIEAGGESSEEEETEEEEGWTPAKGEVCKFKPQGAKKPIEVEITAVFEGKQTVNLKGLDSGKSYKGIPFDKLISD